MRGWVLGGLLALGLAGDLKAADLTVTMHKIDMSGTGEAIGTVTISGGSDGAVFTTDLKGLPAGQHGFHIHANADCGPGPNDQGQVVAGGAAGDHWDPEGTKQHRGPQGGGHLGDLPALTVAADGTAKERLTAPRITDLERLKGHALMIHAGGDTYADQPQPLGGGGGRVACGIIS
jgi:superoxide dismutase, Cu-Zn family